MEIGLVQKVDIDQEMQQSYLDYAMSVIVARALPDARDGMKPVQRRILYAMYDMGLRAVSPYKKSARIVGEVLGKYHPHGDMAVYEAMARLAQDFSVRYPLVDGQGNFGSVDGDPPAAMRYTEARLTPFALEILAQIDRNTVDFERNFDDTLDEPVVLPAAVPNLLVNGASGIAVGMTTNIPPHNLGEVVDALVYLLNGWERLDDIDVANLMKFIQGPDFPTGGLILQSSEQNELLAAYATGRGRIQVRGKVHAEEIGRGRSRMIITELPYQTNKASLIERIAELARGGELEGIADLRDESDRQGMRVVIELKQGVEVEGVLAALYKRTPLQTTFGINLLALVEGEPRLLSLKQALKVYLEHRLEVVRRRSEYDLERARQRAHILEGLRVALNNLDEIIELIRSSADAEKARERLMKRYKLSELQAQAILDMPLRRLAALERKKIELEYKEVVKLIKELEALLKSPKKMRLVVEEELLAIKQTYADRRRTQIVSLKNGDLAKVLLTTKSLTPAKEVWVGITGEGKIARTPAATLPRQAGTQAPCWLLKANTHHTLYLVTTEGRAAAVAIDTLPEAEKFADGAALKQVSALSASDHLAGIFTVPIGKEEIGGRYIMTATKAGLVKKSAVEELPGPAAHLFTLAKVNPGDALEFCLLTDGQSDLILATAGGMLIRFSEEEVRPMGLVAAGVNAIKLAKGDVVAGLERCFSGGEILLVASNGLAWRLAEKEVNRQGRYGQGLQGCKLPAGVRLAGMLLGRRTQTSFIHFKKAAARMIRIDEIPVVKRLAAGKPVLPVKTGDVVTHLTGFIDAAAIWEAKVKPKRPARAK